MSNESRYLCFNLGAEELAIPLLTVKEVIGLPEVTPLPQAPAYFKGIMNLRGQILSILDLRTRLGIKPASQDETSVIILDLNESSIGVIVDRVNSVLQIEEKDLAPKPTVDNSKTHEYINGVYRKDDKLVLIIDVARILSTQDKQTATQATKKAA